MNLRSGTVVGAHILKPEHRPAFEEGVRQIFLRWTALCLAIENQWGGENSAEKGQQLLQEVLQWFFRRKEHFADELEELLDDAISQDFNIDAEDGSPHQVASSLVSIYNECFQGDYSTVQRMQAQAAIGASQSKRQVVDRDGTLMDEDDGSSSGEDGDEDMAGDAMMAEAGPSEPPQPTGPIVDDEGFTLVQGPSKGRRGRK